MRWPTSIFARAKGSWNPRRDSDASGFSSVKIPIDNPLKSPEQDVLGRYELARRFVQQVLSLDAGEGAVVGVLGPWGSGKTTFMNFARAEFDNAGITVVDFNPWMFSGAEQLVERFFSELSGQLRVSPDLSDMVKALDDYSDALSGIELIPVIGPSVKGIRLALKLVTSKLRRQEGGIARLQERVRKALLLLQKPVVVIVDDIDRLSTSEIRDVFKLVRLTANFPNVIYVVAFDRVRVQNALSESGLPGREYLEKILQLTVDLPSMPAEVLDRQILSALDHALAAIRNPGKFDSTRWPDVFFEIIRPLVRNIRDVRRYVLAVYGTASSLDGEVDLVDVLALEAIRTFLPEVFLRLGSAIDGLTETYSNLESAKGTESPLKAQVIGLLEAAGVHDDVVRAMIDGLFPAAGRHIPAEARRLFGGGIYGPEWKGEWLKERRVAHKDVLRLYLERVASEGFQTLRHAEKARSLLSDAVNLDAYLRSLELTRVRGVISALEVFEDEFAPPHVVPAARVLLNLLPDLPNEQGGLFDFGVKVDIARVVLRLLRTLQSPEDVEAAVRQILPQVNSLSSKYELIRIVGHRENAGHKLVSDTAAAEFERQWRDSVRAAKPAELVKERDLLWVLYHAKTEGGPSEPPLEIEYSPELTLAILESARTETVSQALGSRNVERTPRLAWEALVALFGDEQTLRERVEELKSAGLDGSSDVIELAEKHLSGWSPD